MKAFGFPRALFSFSHGVPLVHNGVIRPRKSLPSCHADIVVQLKYKCPGMRSKPPPPCILQFYMYIYGFLFVAYIANYVHT